METLHWVVYVAIAATIFSLGAGVVNMVLDGNAGDERGVMWMTWRVAWQAVAVGLVGFAAASAR